MAELLHEAHRAKLDAVLLSEATTLANVVKMQSESRKPNQPVLQALRVLLNYQSIDSRTATPLWLLQTTRPVRDYLWVMSFKFKISDLVLPDPEGQLTQYAQINGTRGAEWHSESLEERSLPFEVKQFAGTPVLAWRFDDTVLDGMPLRRVILKVARFRIDPPPRSKGPPPPRPMFPPPPPTAIYIQGAYDTSRTDGVLGRMQEGLARALARLEESSQETLATLRHTLLAVSMGAFAVVLLGGFWLVRLGLAPLQRVSEAVSQVSEKDFRLPLDRTRLPVELRPIVERLEHTLEALKRAFAREKQ